MSKIGKVTGGTRSDGGYGSVVTLTDKKQTRFLMNMMFRMAGIRHFI